MISVRTTKSAFISDLHALLDKYSILAPSYVGGKLDYIWVSDPDQIALNDELPYKSPKEAVFPRVEKILSFSDQAIDQSQSIKPMLLIGVKPCDITAFKVLDEVFSGAKGRYPDPFYRNRRDAIVLIGIGCTEKKRGCFCDSRGISMSYSPESDAFITIDGDNLVLDVNCTGLDTLFEAFSGERAESVEPPESFTTGPVLEILADESDIFTAMPWDKYVEGCLGCGTCTYICPTCHCFEFRDVEMNGTVSRYRCWDSCMYPKFTLHASGHNPRSSKTERFRQRVMHKYVYVPKNFDHTACTGCGRCIRSCPGGINIRKAVEDINTRLDGSGAGKGRSE